MKRTIQAARCCLITAMIVLGLMITALTVSARRCYAADSQQLIVDTHFKRGVQFYKQRNYDQAIEEFSRVLEVKPGHVKAKKYLSSSQAKKNDDLILGLYEQADGYTKQGDYQKALDTYQKVSQIGSDGGYASYKITLLQDKLDKRAKAQQRRQDKQTRKQQALERKQLKQKQSSKEGQARPKERPCSVSLPRQQPDESSAAQKEKELSTEMALAEAESLLAQRDKHINEIIESMPSAAIQQPVVPVAMSEEEIRKNSRQAYLQAKRHYAKKDYKHAITLFKQVLALEQQSSKRYTKAARDYINKAERKLQQQQMRQVKEIQSLEREMINRLVKEYQKR